MKIRVIPREKRIRIIGAVMLLVFLFLPFHFALSEKGFTLYRVKGKKYIRLQELTGKCRIDTGYDIETGRVKLYYRGNRAVIQGGYRFIIVNRFLVRGPAPVIRKGGEIYLPEKMGLAIVKSFFPRRVPRKKGKKYVLKGKDPAERKKSTRKKTDNFPITFIIIDPGHGGKDPGAIGQGGLKEKNMTLKISRLVRSKLKKRLKNVRIIMTRNSDRFIELSGRTEMANKRLRKNNNGIFLSIHVNASISRRISGYETYFLSQNPTNDEARSTAALENDVIVYEKGKNKREKYGDIEYIVAHMMTTQIQRESAMLAGTVQKGMSRMNRRFKSRGVRKADFYVLRGALMPAVLIEVGFITNRKEAKWLIRRSHQRKIAEGIARGVIDFLKKYNRTVRRGR